MVYSRKLYVPAVLLSCLVAGCSSSSGATPDTAYNAGTAGETTIPPGTADTGTTGPGSTDAESTSNEMPITSIAGAAPVAMIQGDWETQCMAESSLLYTKQSISVNGSNLVQELGWFSDPDCTVPQPIGFLLNGSTTQVNVVSVPTGATVSTTLGEAVAVDFYFDVPTIDYAPIPEELVGLDGFAEEIIYDIVLVSEDKLFFGDIDGVPEKDGSSPQTRPISLDLGFMFNRVQ